MAKPRKHTKIPTWRFYEYSFERDITLAWRQDPDGNVSYLGKVRPGTARALAKAFSMNCRSAHSEEGLPDVFEGLLN